MKLTRKLGRSPAGRYHLIRNLLAALVREEQIVTTISRAKELRRHADRIVGVGKKGGVKNWRRAFGLLGSKPVVQKLFQQLVPRYKDRPGNYCRVLRAGQRKGDAADIAIIEYLQPDYVSVQPRKTNIASAPKWMQCDESNSNFILPEKIRLPPPVMPQRRVQKPVYKLVKSARKSKAKLMKKLQEEDEDDDFDKL